MDVLRGVGGSRLGWDELPTRVRSGVQSMLGAPVVAATSQPGGFSPGVAARLRLADGRRAFVKAVSAARNPDSPGMHRREAAMLAALPDAISAPRLYGCYDDGDWVALAQQDLDGGMPAIPWRAGELTRVLAAMHELAEQLTPSPIDAGPVGARLADRFDRWRWLAERPDAGVGLPAWARDNVDRLAALESQWIPAAAGTTLLHLDLRADNTLLTPDRVMFVDWSDVGVGAAWVDLLLMVPSVVMQGGPDAERIWRDAPVSRDADDDRVNAVLAALTGFFLVNSLRPPPPNLPTVRRFQRVQGEAALGWLRSRLR
jgi:aminoglycoside phosphotransferase